MRTPTDTVWIMGSHNAIGVTDVAKCCQYGYRSGPFLVGRSFQFFTMFLCPGFVGRFPRMCNPKNRGNCTAILQYLHRPPQKSATPAPHKYVTNCRAVILASLQANAMHPQLPQTARNTQLTFVILRWALGFVLFLVLFYSSSSSAFLPVPLCLPFSLGCHAPYARPFIVLNPSEPYQSPLMQTLRALT